MSDSPDWTLLGRYLRGACSPAEIDAVERWKNADEANADVLTLMREVWDECAVDMPEIDKAAAWRNLQASIAAATRPAVVRQIRLMPDLEERPRRTWLRRTLIGGAAAAVVAAVGTVAWRQSTVEAPVQPGREYATTRGQRAELVLVDGTRVWLNSESRLRVPAGFGTKGRDLTLEGEAYFRVRRDDERPFRVHTPGAVSEDLGTEFNVRAYADERDLRVVVASGRVALHRAADSGSAGEAPDGPSRVDLTEGQMGRLDRTGRLSMVDGVDLEAMLSWRDGDLRFIRRPAAEVLHELERWYDIEISIDDSSLARVPITATLGTSTVDHALAIVAGVLEARFTRDDRRVRITTVSARP